MENDKNKTYREWYNELPLTRYPASVLFNSWALFYLYPTNLRRISQSFCGLGWKEHGLWRYICILILTLGVQTLGFESYFSWWSRRGLELAAYSRFPPLSKMISRCSWVINERTWRKRNLNIYDMGNWINCISYVLFFAWPEHKAHNQKSGFLKNEICLQKSLSTYIWTEKPHVAGGLR